MIAIYKRELQSYMQNMIGCIFIAFVTGYIGIYFMAMNVTYGYPYFAYTLESGTFILMIGIPLLTMRSFAEERKNKTDQLLLTSPVSLFSVVMGKFLSTVTILAIPSVIFCIFPLVIQAQGTAYFKIDYCSILMFFLLGCVFISIGIFLSSLTESQIIAVIMSFGVLLLLYLWESLEYFLPSSAISNLVIIIALWTLLAFAIYQLMRSWLTALIVEVVGVAAEIVIYVWNSTLYESLISNVMSHLSVMGVYNDLTENHLFDISGVVLYLSLIGIFFFLTMQSIQKRRWS